MKVGILTPHCARNYGGVFQAFALQTVIEQMGHDPQIVNLVPASRRSKSIFPMPWKNKKGCILNLLALMRYSQTKRYFQNYADFNKKYFRLTEKEYQLYDQIKADLPAFDAYVCGSDQLWRPGMHSRDTIRAYALEFVKSEDAKKVAYAPSFGVSTLPENHQEFIAPLIDDITHLSVREKTGQDIVRDLTGREPPVVLDPTLLLDAEFWSTVAAPPRITEPYTLVYCQSQRQNFYDLVQHVKQTTKLPVVVMSLVPINRIPGADHVYYDTSPLEYLGLIANAACVCTNSFHGTAFSIINKRPFWTVPHESANSRLAGLLERIGLSDRQVAGPDQYPTDPLEIDYTNAYPKLEEARRESRGYLENALSAE
jgi:hypothetical protein